MASLHLAQEILNIIYPVGSVYMSFSSTDPKNLFGGTWTQIKGRVLVGLDSGDSDFNTSGKTGGSKDMQSHTHSGVTGGGLTSFLRVCGSSGTSIAVNHLPGHSGGAYTDTNGGNFPGANHYHEFTTNSAGNGNSGNLQPYMVCYIWRRTA